MTTYKLLCEGLDRESAQALAGALEELVAEPPHALSLFEQPGDASFWRIEAYFSEMPDTGALAAELAELTGLTVSNLEAGAVEEKNWVALSQAALPPVRAGRFTVYGSHDRGRVVRGPNTILIDAGEAFGTAHHPTTYGCLEAISVLTRRGSFKRVLDLGCGSGVLAIAVARMLPNARIWASDLDVRSVEVARENMQLNGAGGRIIALAGDGVHHHQLRAAAPFDFLIANILAGPLIVMARDLAKSVRPGGTLLLSGLLNAQAREVAAAYAAVGFFMVSHRRINGWSTLTLRRR